MCLLCSVRHSDPCDSDVVFLIQLVFYFSSKPWDAFAVVLLIHLWYAALDQVFVVGYYAAVSLYKSLPLIWDKVIMGTFSGRCPSGRVRLPAGARAAGLLGGAVSVAPALYLDDPWCPSAGLRWAGERAEEPAKTPVVRPGWSGPGAREWVVGWRATNGGQGVVERGERMGQL